MENNEFKILVIDGSLYFQDYFSRNVQPGIDAKVQFVESLDKGIDIIGGPLGPDLIVMDANLTDTRGERAVKTLRSEHQLENIPIICITDHATSDANKDVLDWGADDFVPRNAPAGVMIARIKTQRRHKLAIDRLGKMALDRDMFAAGVLHDIRNIETTISIVCEFTAMKLQKDPEVHKQEIDNNLNTLINSASKLGTYAADVIKSVRVTERSVRAKEVDLKGLLDWATDLVMTKKGSATIEKIEWRAANPLRKVLADEDLLKLAIFNIVQNSVKYRDQKNPQRLEVTQECQSPNSGTGRGIITTRIRDFGKGVIKSELKRIFEPFKRGSDQVKGSGFGLGLSMVSKVIGRMGGRVWAELPSSGPGLVICLQLPAVEACLQ